MYSFPAKSQKWLKIFHIIFACAWMGGALSLLSLNALRAAASSDGMLVGINMAFHQVDMYIVVIIGALGCAVTGLLYSLFTPWGFIKHGWVLAKWIATLFCMVSGTFLLGPWEEGMLALSQTKGLAATADELYAAMQAGSNWMSPLQTVLHVFMIVISVLKPWSNWRSKKNRAARQAESGTGAA